jgi:hypothetical protein
MADDQKPKTMDIDDLVRELSKSSTSPGTPAPAPQTARPSFPTPRPSTSTPMTGSTPAPFMPKPTVPSPSTPPSVIPPKPKPLEMPKPQFGVPPVAFSQPLAGQAKPAATPAPATPSPTPGIKEYQSSIRTMGEDISKIKQGQQPAGVAIPRKVEQVTPPPPVTPPPVKPAAPGPQFKVPNVNLGETQKSAPMAPSRGLPGATIPKASFGTPSVPKSGGSAPAPQIYVPQEGQKGGNRNMLFIGIGAVALVAGFAYWFFVLRSPAPEIVVETPTPTPTETMAPTPTPTLTSIFSGVNTQTVLLSPGETGSNFVKNISNGTINGGEFIKIYTSENDMSLPITQLLDSFKLAYPAGLKDLMGQDYAIFAYGQREIFDSKGQIKTDAVVEKRLVMIGEITDPAAVSQLGRVWETDMANNLKTIFQIDPKKQASPNFSDNSYKGVAIRYKNFKYSDRTIDYAIVPALNGKTYMVITGSRESIFATIDKLVSP